MNRSLLRVQAPDVPPVQHALSKDGVVIGRGNDCTLPIRDRFLSRRHAEVVSVGDGFVLRDCGSANGTFLNGTRVEGEMTLHPGDEIRIGDTSIVYEELSISRVPQITDEASSPSIIIPLAELDSTAGVRSREAARTSIIAALAVELIEERGTETLLEFVVDRVHAMLHPSRTAVALFDKPGGQLVHTIARGDSDEHLSISRTLLNEVTEKRNAIAFVDVASDERFAQAKSIIGQSIRSAVCAPLLTGDRVLGVLYVDYTLTSHDVADEDVRLLARIARLAATKLETARLRDEEVAKQRMEEELKTAYAIQSRLLPAEPPSIDGYSVAGHNRPARTVSGDYFDYVERPDGRYYFVVADVSGKGITAALVMAGLATAFNIFTAEDPSPAELVTKLNRTLAPKLMSGKFVTLFAGVLDPATGRVEFANAGHCPPVILNTDGDRELKSTDLVVGLFPQAVYRNQELTLKPGDVMFMFTDGIIEAEDSDGEELGLEPILETARTSIGDTAEEFLTAIFKRVRAHTGGGEQGDDITMVAVMRNRG